MKIRRLEISGFKSFADRVVFSFDEGVTGVVGPNGCGKSNVVDAIRWAMGEQSAKHLRGRAMEDVIFSGSESRPATGMAEVSRRLLAHRPADGVDDVRLAAPVRTDDADDVLVEVDDRAIDEGLEAADLELLDVHWSAR